LLLVEEEAPRRVDKWEDAWSRCNGSQLSGVLATVYHEFEALHLQPIALREKAGTLKAVLLMPEGARNWPVPSPPV
jgi:hypothetical protein